MNENLRELWALAYPDLDPDENLELENVTSNDIVATYVLGVQKTLRLLFEHDRHGRYRLRDAASAPEIAALLLAPFDSGELCNGCGHPHHDANMTQH